MAGLLRPDSTCPNTGMCLPFGSGEGGREGGREVVGGREKWWEGGKWWWRSDIY